MNYRDFSESTERYSDFFHEALTCACGDVDCTIVPPTKKVQTATEWSRLTILPRQRGSVKTRSRKTGVWPSQPLSGDLVRSWARAGSINICTADIFGVVFFVVAGGAVGCLSAPGFYLPGTRSIPSVVKIEDVPYGTKGCQKGSIGLDHPNFCKF